MTDGNTKTVKSLKANRSRLLSGLRSNLQTLF